MGLSRDLSQREKFDRLVEDIVTRKYPYEPKETKPIDWSKYTEAQVRELNATLEIIRDAVDQVEYEPTRSTGRPREYNLKDLVKIILLQAYFGCSNRLAAGYALVFREKLELERDVHYKAIERAYGDEEVRVVLRKVFDLTQEAEKPHVEGFTIDGSGIPRDTKGNWERDKQTPSDAKHERFSGSIVMLTVPHQIVTAHVPFPVGFGSESPHLKTLVEQTLARYQDAFHGIVSADAAFLSRSNCQLIHDAGAKPRIFPKRGIRLQQQGLSAWRKMQADLLADTQTWLREYHQRSLSESAWSRHKRRHTSPLRKRLQPRLHTEQAARFTTDNLSRLVTLSVTEGLRLTPLRRAAG